MIVWHNDEPEPTPLWWEEHPGTVSLVIFLVLVVLKAGTTWGWWR